MRIWVGIVAATALAGGLLLWAWPLGDGSYDCLRSPISLVRDPAPEQGPGFEFFDDGEACNRDARERLRLVGWVVGGGLALAGVVAVTREPYHRRRDRVPRWRWTG